jgi:predicted RNA-binding protein associated with RNAse of E/G family
MLKRRYGDRSEWKRILKRQYSQKFLDTEAFRGYVTLLHIHKVTEPLIVNYEEKSICIVDDGYMWLQHFPSNEHYSLTTMFDASGEVVQWYIDITNENGIENNLPYTDDLFLDIIVLSSGEVIQKDADELEEAYTKGTINQAQYQLVWAEANKINQQIENNDFQLMGLTKSHLNILLED